MIFAYICVVCMSMSVCSRVCGYTCVRKLKTDCYPPYTSRQALLLNPGLTVLTSLANQLVLGFLMTLGFPEST